VTATAPPAAGTLEPATLTAAGAAAAAAGHPAAGGVAPAHVTDPYPYAEPLECGGPSFVRDAWAALENPGSSEADRWRKAQAMAAEPAFVRAGLARIGRVHATPNASELEAATGTTGNQGALVPNRWLPGRYVPLVGAKAPLYTSITKLGTPDFSTLEVPRTLAETGLSGLPANETTPIAPGDITTTSDQIIIQEVEGAYLFSRKLLMGSNPQIDRIALDAMNRAWLADVEGRAVTYYVNGTNTHTAVSAAYTDGLEYTQALRGVMAALASDTIYQATVVLPPKLEYQAVAAADDASGRPLLPYGPQVNASGESAAGYASVAVQGVPLLPGPYQPADKTVVLDQSMDAAIAFATPVMDFRLEWTTDATSGGNVKVLKLVKYSGVGFWSQYPGGVVVITNTSPLAAAADEADAGNGGTRAARK
jgi:hypothetical protein